MGNLTLKSVGLFIAFWMVWFAPAIVATYTLMNNTPEQIEFIIKVVLLIWFIFAIIASIIVFVLVKPFENNYERRKELSDNDLVNSTRKAINLYYVVSAFYALIWLIATIILFIFFKSEFGNLAANSIWVGGLAGLLAVPFMCFSTFPLIHSGATSKMVEEVNRRKLSVKGTYITVKNKLILQMFFSILGIAVWVGTFGFYTGINEMVKEVESSRNDRLSVIVQQITDNNSKNTKEELITKINKIALPQNEALFLVDNKNTLLGDLVNTKLFENKSKNISTLIEGRDPNATALYDNINQNVINYKSIDESYTLIALTNINEKTKRLNHFWLWFAFFMVIGLVVTFTNSLTLAAWMGKTINKLRELFEKLAANDYSSNAAKDSEDELGVIMDKYNEFIFEVRGLITKIQDTSVSVLNAGDQLSTISQQISQGANEQASTTEQISASMEEMLSTIVSNTDDAENTYLKTSKSSDSLQESSKIILQTIELVNKISQETELIFDIAFQTNILALNASIEAARAGEHGKGFAVVASEVRKLAERSKDALDKIQDLTKSGKGMSEIAGKSLAKSLPEIAENAELMKKIAEASREQKTGTDQINNSIQQLTEITNQNSASSEEMSASAEELTSQSQELKDLLTVFKTT